MGTALTNNNANMGTNVTPNTSVVLDPAEGAEDLVAEQEEEAVDPSAEPDQERDVQGQDYHFDNQGRANGSNRGGSERKITDQQINDALVYITEGVSRKTACALVGIHPTSLAAICDNDENVGARLAMADAKAEHAAILKVMEGKSGWQAAAWWLERRRRAEYSVNAQDNDQEERIIRIRHRVRAANGQTGTSNGVGTTAGPIRPRQRAGRS